MAPLLHRAAINSNLCSACSAKFSEVYLAEVNRTLNRLHVLELYSIHMSGLTVQTGLSTQLNKTNSSV